MSDKVKKSIFRRWWFWAIAVIVVIGVVSSGGNDEQPASTTANGSQGAQETKKEEPKKEEPKNKPAMSKAEFEQIQNGMSYEEVTAIVGGPGELSSETGTKGDEFYTAAYTFKGESLGANAILMFQGGKLMSKSQAGLK